MYQPLRASRSERLPIRTLDYHVRLWEPAGGAAAGAPPLVMVPVSYTHLTLPTIYSV